MRKRIIMLSLPIVSLGCLIITGSSCSDPSADAPSDILADADLSSSDAAGSDADGEPDFGELTTDEQWHRLNEQICYLLGYTRRINTASLFLTRALSRDFTVPISQFEGEFSQQELTWLAWGAAAFTIAPLDGATGQGRGECTSIYDDAEFWKAMGAVKNGVKMEEYLGEEAQPDPVSETSYVKGLFDKLGSLLESKGSELDEMGDYAQDTYMKCIIQYLDQNWDILPHKTKCCVEQRLGELRTDFSYTNFKNHVNFPSSYTDPLTPTEKGVLLPRLVDCVPLLANCTKDKLFKIARNSAEKGSEYYYENTKMMGDEEAMWDFVTRKGREVVLDGLLDWWDGTGGRGNAADAVVVLLPQDDTQPVIFAPLQYKNGRMVIERPRVGTYDLYLFVPNRRPITIPAVEVAEDQEKVITVKEMQKLAPDPKATFPATMNDCSGDEPPEPPPLPPVEGCPCTTYRFYNTSEMSCAPGPEDLVPPFYTKVTYEGEGFFQVFEEDYTFEDWQTSKELPPFTVSYTSSRQCFEGEYEGATFAHEPSSYLLQGELSVTLELLQEDGGICLNILTEVLTNPTQLVTETVTDLETGAVVTGQTEETLFLSFDPMGIYSQYGCGFPGPVVIHSDGNPSLPGLNCTFVVDVIIMPVE